MRFLILCLIVGLLAISSVAFAQCENGVCTLTVEASVAEAGHPFLATAGRSVGAVGKVAALPVRVVAAIAEKKPVRSALKGIAERKPVRRTVAGAARLICPGKRGCE